MRHINIPIFIPHLGCPNQCIFCNQRYISGTQEFRETDVDKQIKDVLSTVSVNDKCEIAFFGGSFTGIDRELMVRLLDKAQKYVDDGLVESIRMSTRPDYITEEIISILKNYTISVVELGIQTMSDDILKLLKRGHTVTDTIKAAELLNSADIKFVGQMMIGLPGASLQDEEYCAEQICKLGAVASRIYPTLIFKNTELENMTNEGKYKPIGLDEAIERSARVLDIFEKNNVKCIRIGLCDSDNLHSSDTYLAGPNSPSIGEMVKSRLFYNVVCEQLYKQGLKGKELYIYCPLGKRSQVIGHRRINIKNLINNFSFERIIVIENEHLENYDIILKEKEEKPCV